MDIADGIAAIRDNLLFFQPAVTATSVDNRKDEIEELVQILRDAAPPGTPETHDSLLYTRLATVVRLAYGSPLVEIRSACEQLVQQAGGLGWTLPAPENPSYFIGYNFLPSVQTEDTVLRDLYEEIFCRNHGIVTNLEHVFSCHKTFLDSFYVTMDFLMRDAGPLPPSWRNYIAILAASRFGCTYIVVHQGVHFLMNDGDPSWLEGVDKAPAKLQDLLQLNAMLAHQPWLVRRSHIELLLKGGDAWSVGELVQAILLMSTFHALCGVVNGCGVAPEVDFATVIAPQQYDTEDDGSTTNETDHILDLLKNQKNPNQSQCTEDEERAQQFERAAADDFPVNRTTSRCNPLVHERFTGGYPNNYVDFDVKSKDYQIFRVQSYNWNDHVFALINRYYPDAANVLDAEFNLVRDLTYYSFSQNQDVDTQPFRRGVWYYAQRLLGMLHDDYDYQEVNVFLNRSTKMFVKKVTCCPDQLGRTDFSNMGLEIRPDEKVHVAMLSFEARRQASMVYGLHAVMKYMQ